MDGWALAGLPRNERGEVRGLVGDRSFFNRSLLDEIVDTTLYRALASWEQEPRISIP
jgi:hypothetical protein